MWLRSCRHAARGAQRKLRDVTCSEACRRVSPSTSAVWICSGRQETMRSLRRKAQGGPRFRLEGPCVLKVLGRHRALHTQNHVLVPLSGWREQSPGPSLCQQEQHSHGQSPCQCPDKSCIAFQQRLKPGRSAHKPIQAHIPEPCTMLCSINPLQRRVPVACSGCHRAPAAQSHSSNKSPDLGYRRLKRLGSHLVVAQLHGFAHHGDGGAAVFWLLQQRCDGLDSARNGHKAQKHQRREGLCDTRVQGSGSRALESALAVSTHGVAILNGNSERDWSQQACARPREREMVLQPICARPRPTIPGSRIRV